ncbi:HAD-IA family hydrolase [Glycomyces terrestris]|uniref:HAD family hydrolase n=1 Tax=Glycomyces terrestris TaxID=2493553 RepID=A0A426V111_9ACTN|nr:HAD-IA family hydrolase [Glycomyces terrestris]RRS00554.1 HAD family hydrolase [Glycomyces terrestris]
MRSYNPAAVLFDMDGTLVDSDGAVERAWTAWAAEYGVDPAAVLPEIHGRTAAASVARFRPDLDPEAALAAVAWMAERECTDLDGVAANRGAHRLLAALERSSIPWAVVTSANQRLAKARLNAAGIEPPLLVTVDDVARGKPDPEGYLMAAEALGADPAECLVVEDSETGLAAGRASGARTAALRGLPGDLSIGSLDDLADLIERGAYAAAVDGD